MKKMISLLVLLSLACMSTAKIAAPLVTVTSTKPVSTSALVVRSTPVPTSVPTAVYRTLCGNVNVRGNPSAAGISYGNKLIGESVQVLEMRGGWVRIGQDRWIVNKLCK